MNRWTNSKFLRGLHRKSIKTWQIALLVVIFSVCSALTLRSNNLQMVYLRQQVIAADTKGVGVSERLRQLNSYIFKHMNTQVVRPIELVGTYNRQAQAVIQNAQKGSGRDIYAEGTAACERRGIPLSSIAQCIAQYANQNAQSVAEQKIRLPDKNLFVYSFASPLWTPDLAGISVLLTVVFTIWLLTRLIEFLIVRLIVRHRLKNGL